MIKGYLSTKDLAERYRCSTRTIFRWAASKNNSFPQSKLTASGSQSLWAIDDIEQWEEQNGNKAA